MSDKWTIATCLPLGKNDFGTREYAMALSWSHDGESDDVVVRVAVKQWSPHNPAGDTLFAVRCTSDSPLAEIRAAVWLQGRGQFDALLACARARQDNAAIAAFTFEEA